MESVTVTLETAPTLSALLVALAFEEVLAEQADRTRAADTTTRESILGKLLFFFMGYPFNPFISC
jgi:hypothetical protein